MLFSKSLSSIHAVKLRSAKGKLLACFCRSVFSSTLLLFSPLSTLPLSSFWRSLPIICRLPVVLPLPFLPYSEGCLLNTKQKNYYNKLRNKIVNKTSEKVADFCAWPLLLVLVAADAAVVFALSRCRRSRSLGGQTSLNAMKSKFDLLQSTGFFWTF